MKKTEVYVVVDTPKKAKKLKKVLDMFFETHTGSAIGSDYYDGVKLFNDTWCAIRTKREVKDETEVSIKQLRNILAKEHLKDGDYVVVNGIDGVVKITNVFDYSFEFNKNTHCTFNCFIRYATEEEKDLLEPKKELEVGKWYKSWNDSYNGYDLSYYTGTGTYYGFHAENNNWFEDQYWIKNSMTSEWQEATPQEVEQALIEEAKSRGLVKGVKIKSVDDVEITPNGSFVLKQGVLYYGGATIFIKGKWAAVIKQDNFTDSDIAIVERLHDSLLDNHGYSLESELLTDARMLANKIKSNIK